MDLMWSKCKEGYHGHHEWSPIGVIVVGMHIEQILLCTQCKNYITRVLQPLEVDKNDKS